MVQSRARERLPATGAHRQNALGELDPMGRMRVGAFVAGAPARSGTHMHRSRKKSCSLPVPCVAFLASLGRIRRCMRLLEQCRSQWYACCVREPILKSPLPRLS